MTLENLISAHILPANSNHELIHPDQSTDDIIQLILKADAIPQVQKDTEPFAPLLADNSLRDTCHNIYTALRAHVRFVEDPAGDQFLKSPAQVWKDKKCDCKSFSLFIGSCLKNIGITYMYRFVSENKNENIHHVYIVVPDGNREIIIDCTLTSFNRELPYAYKKDFLISNGAINAMSGTTSGSGAWLLLLVLIGIVLSSR